MRARPGRRNLLLGAPALLLGGCGFHPLYARNGAVAGAAQDDLAATSVDRIPEHSGQLMRQALQARFERTGAGQAYRYALTVTFGVTPEGLGIMPDTSTTRMRLSGTAVWTLRSLGVETATLGSGTARLLDGYDIINNQYFAADQSQDAATKRLAENLADLVTEQVAAYFTRHPTAG